MKSLLQLAKEAPIRKTKQVSDQEIELALAWIKNEITQSQVAKALGISPTGNRGYAELSRALKEAFKRGYLRIGPWERAE